MTTKSTMQTHSVMATTVVRFGVGTFKVETAAETFALFIRI